MAGTDFKSAYRRIMDDHFPERMEISFVGAQGRQTLALLQVLVDYNRAIAEYALSVLPPATDADRLAAALVLKP